MRGTWRDPDDITPGARRAPKEVRGWRSLCLLRRMAASPTTDITPAHIMAADKLRELVDVATLGYSTPRPLIYVAQFPLPRFGMNPAQVRQVAAIREVRRVMRIFLPAQLIMLEAIVLRNMALNVWARERRENPAVAKGRLLSILDQLVQHFATEIEDELARGRRLAL